MSRGQGSPGPEDGPEGSSSQAVRLIQAIEARLRYRPSPEVERVFLVLAGLVFFVGGIFAIRAIRVDPSALRWVPLLASGVLGVPLTTLGSALEFRLMARGLGATVSLTEALRVSVLSGAANLLPLPGSVIVRVQALTGAGQSLVRSTGATGAMGLAWLSWSFIMAGLVLLFERHFLLAGVFLALGTAGAVPAGWLLRYAAQPGTRLVQVRDIVAVELFTVAVAALRTWLVLLGLGVSATASQSFVLPVAGAIVALVGFVPGGMGLREVVTAALAPVVGLQASVGFLVSAIHRILGAVIYGPLVAALTMGRSGSEP